MGGETGHNGPGSQEHHVPRIDREHADELIETLWPIVEAETSRSGLGRFREDLFREAIRRCRQAYRESGRRPTKSECDAAVHRVTAEFARDDLRRLVEEASTGDDEAEARLLEIVRERALRHATRLGRKTGAEDTAQNVVLIVIRILRSESETLNPATIGGLIATLARRDWKDERGRRERHATADLSPLNPSGEPDPADAAGRDETRARVRDAVARLPEEDRHLFELRHWAGLSHQEIARRLGMARKSVARWLRRVTVELHRYLREPRSDSGSGARRWRAPLPEFPEADESSGPREGI